jgi:hypothetical protein
MNDDANPLTAIVPARYRRILSGISAGVVTYRNAPDTIPPMTMSPGWFSCNFLSSMRKAYIAVRTSQKSMIGMLICSDKVGWHATIGYSP